MWSDLNVISPWPNDGLYPAIARHSQGLYFSNKKDGPAPSFFVVEIKMIS